MYGQVGTFYCSSQIKPAFDISQPFNQRQFVPFSVIHSLSMDSRTEKCRVPQTARYPTLMYFILLGIVSETFYLHYNTEFRSDALKRRIDDLERQQGLTLRKMTHDRRLATEEKQVYVELVRRLKEKVKIRVKRDVDEKSKSILRTITQLQLHFLRSLKRDLVKQDNCRNSTLVCKKGERGPRGKAGPRGLKGEIGAKGERGTKGERGASGPKGKTGPSGQKGEKGDPGPPGMSIQKPKIVTSFTKEVIKRESDNLTLFCEANGNPRPDIRWGVDEKKIDSRYTFPIRGALAISSVKKSDQGRIKCIAENILGKDVIETKLVVHSKPKVNLQSHKLVAAMDNPLAIICNVEGSPLPTLKWERGYGKLTARQVLSDGNRNLTLKFDEPSESDTGYYICKAENYVGQSEQSILLIVKRAPSECSSYKGKGKSGVYTIDPDGKQPFKVFCDMDTDKGGWTVIQRRLDGSVDFFKNWLDYKRGFGSIENEFWLGNDKIHRLTKRKNMMIRFDLEDVDGNKVFAEYKVFYVDGENENYRVHVQSYTGTAGDSFSYHNGMQFSTKDRDNDKGVSYGCAKKFHGAWWYNACLLSNLNGMYLNGINGKDGVGVVWYHFKGTKNSLRKSEMKVRPAIP